MKCDHCSKIFKENDTIYIIERRTGLYPFQYDNDKTELLDLLYYCNDEDCSEDRLREGIMW